MKNNSNNKNQQQINCDVCACQHQDNSNNCCKLNSITVAPVDEHSTTHYCKNYKQK